MKHPPLHVRPVAAVVPDSLAAVRSVRYAARLASDWGRPLLLLVPLPGAVLSLGPALHLAGRRRRDDEAAAVRAQVGPSLAELQVPASSAQAVSYRPRHTRRPAFDACLCVARQHVAEVLVVDGRSAGTGAAQGLVLLDLESGLTASGQPTPDGYPGKPDRSSIF